MKDKDPRRRVIEKIATIVQNQEKPLRSVPAKSQRAPHPGHQVSRKRTVSAFKEAGKRQPQTVIKEQLVTCKVVVCPQGRAIDIGSTVMYI